MRSVRFARPAAVAAGVLVAVWLGLFWLRLLDRHAFAAIERQAAAARVHRAVQDLVATESTRDGTVIHLDRGVRPSLLSTGWSDAEPPGVWSAGPSAALTLVHLRPGAPATVTLTLRPFLAPGLPAQRVRISAGERLLAEASLSAPGFQRLTLIVPPEVQAPAGQATLALDLPDAASPARRTPDSTDLRRLAVMLQSVEVTG